MTENQLKKEKKWLFFALGIIAGFILCGAYTVISEMVHNKSQSFTQSIRHIYHHGADKDTVVKYVQVAQKSTNKSEKDKLSDNVDSLALMSETDNLDEVDFYMDEEDVADDNDNVVVVDKILAKKTIKVLFKDIEMNDVPAFDNAISHFDVQQWNTPIKNKISYHRDNAVLQVKGLPIDKVVIVCIEHQYYLHHAGQYYLLENNESFEKIGSPVVLKSSKS